MAVCYAMYKTLFTQDIHSHMIGRNRAILHCLLQANAALADGNAWRAYELSYEELVTKQVAETRRLLAYCGLEWEMDAYHFIKIRRRAPPQAHHRFVARFTTLRCRCGVAMRASSPTEGAVHRTGICI